MDWLWWPNRQRACVLMLVASVMCYYLAMDITLYRTIQSVNLVNEHRTPGELWSPFRPLSVKLIMQDPTTHYVLTPISEYFNEITHFSQVFYFITPNMVTFTHVFLAIISIKFLYSDSLKSRRIGVLIYEARSLLDCFDGTVYRAQSTQKNYESHHSELGFWVDSTSDTLGGFLLMFSVLFVLWWKQPPRKEIGSLPWTSDDKEPLTDSHCESHDVRNSKSYTRKFIFWRCFCFGMQIGIASAMWDQVMWNYTDIYNARLANPQLAELQAAAQHSGTMSLIWWGWRMLEGQALVHYVLLAIFMDKIWEFLRFVQYLGFVVLGLLVGFSYYHISELRHMLQLVPTEGTVSSGAHSDVTASAAAGATPAVQASIGQSSR